MYLATTNPSLHGLSLYLKKSKIKSYDFPDFFLLSSIILHGSLPFSFLTLHFLLLSLSSEIQYRLLSSASASALLSHLLTSPHSYSLLTPLFYYLLSALLCSILPSPSLSSLLLSPLHSPLLNSPLSSLLLSPLRSPLLNSSLSYALLSYALLFPILSSAVLIYIPQPTHLIT